MKGLKSACQIFRGGPCEKRSRDEFILLYAKAKFPGNQTHATYAAKVAAPEGHTGWDAHHFKTKERALQFNIANRAPVYVDMLTQYGALSA